MRDADQAAATELARRGLPLNREPDTPEPAEQLDLLTLTTHPGAEPGTGQLATPEAEQDGTHTVEPEHVATSADTTPAADTDHPAHEADDQTAYDRTDLSPTTPGRTLNGSESVDTPPADTPDAEGPAADGATTRRCPPTTEAIDAVGETPEPATTGQAVSPSCRA